MSVLLVISFYQFPAYEVTFMASCYIILDSLSHLTVGSRALSPANWRPHCTLHIFFLLMLHWIECGREPKCCVIGG